MSSSDISPSSLETTSDESGSASDTLPFSLSTLITTAFFPAALLESPNNNTKWPTAGLSACVPSFGFSL
ncbi:predicted protein [Arabidopsis lyrata subsp. lyrata]|uniref:Predicted protein n=1 Tax=Arabidopsis lyrata subsp. lyrata TaxID=81972 RepID=D7KN52_ARALL|nr:predicted protein [Arabidopsis lyrata subsp. lyrata]